MTKKVFFILLIIYVVGFFLRIMYLSQGSLSFAYDQARDAFMINEMINGDIKILGPSVSGIPGLYHGVLYYYVILPAYLLGNGNPLVVAYYLSFISTLGIFAVFYLAFILTRKVGAGIVSALIFAFSFEASQYSNLLTNASMGAWFVPFIYIGLFLWIKKAHRWAPIITGLALGLSVQSEIALAYHVVPVVLWLSTIWKRITKTNIVEFVGAFSIAVSTMLVSEVKFGFAGVWGIVYLLTSQDGIVQVKQFSDYVITALNQSAKVFANTLFPDNLVFGGLLGFIITIVALKTKTFWGKLLISCLFAYLIALPFGGWNMRHILVGAAPVLAVMTGITIWTYLGKNKILVALALVVILGSNLVKIVEENKNGQTLFPFQNMTLANQMAVVDYTYQTTKGEPFSISTLTNPLFVNTVWSFIYNQYGVSKYGYLPYWVGRDQIGQLGNNLIYPPENNSTHFFIIEPTYGIPQQWVIYAHGDQDAMSTLKDQKEFGEVMVQTRQVKPKNVSN